ncbi:hypothetical protein [Mesorhizobium sp. DCY119]|uniref:hypothetical protein n=1 Tax=Mesorhizobium sp. DCY119 TaxID=2108445 RepID=UPI000E6D3AE0|nr:hypothetical protein [Mesorhizobium sp. DCY119]RJG46544.1 hypothetical protein D3Y55_21355 [Mesorhizobium sp. DCY119]
MPPEDEFFELGDVVEHKMNTSVFGIVIGFAGSLVYIRVSPSLAVLAFHEWELHRVENDEFHGGGSGDNVIPVDFTKKVRLDKNTKTKGAA